MICNSCNNKNICKHYDYIIKAIDLKVEVKECSFKKDYIDELLDKSFMSITKTESSNKYFSPESNVALLNNNVSTKDVSIDYKELSNKINKDRAINDFKVTSVPTELAICDNPDCNAQVYEEDKSVCSICGKSTCPVCSYTDMIEINSVVDESSMDSFNSLKIICEDCHKATDVLPNTYSKQEQVKLDKATDNPFNIDIFGGDSNE